MAIIGSSKGWSNLRRKKKVRKNKLRCYEFRDEVQIHQAGYSDYQEYLRSEEWQVIRRKKLTEQPLCLCSSKASQVHHMSYDLKTMMGHSPKLLVSLCDQCHEHIELEGSRKCTLQEANQRLLILAYQTDSGKRWLSHVASELKKVDSINSRDQRIYRAIKIIEGLIEKVESSAMEKQQARSFRRRLRKVSNSKANGIRFQLELLTKFEKEVRDALSRSRQ